MKNKFSPASDTLAVMVFRGAVEPVAKLVVSQDCVLLTLIVSIVNAVLTPYRESHISLKAGQTVHFVASEREGYSYIVFLYADGSSLCSCRDGCQRKHCTHVDDAVSYEARCQAETAKAGLLERKELRNGTILYIFQSSRSEYQYFITGTVDGRIDNETHEDCEGFHYRRSCRHMDVVLADQRPAWQAHCAAQDAARAAHWTAYKSSASYKQAFGEKE